MNWNLLQMYLNTSLLCKLLTLNSLIQIHNSGCDRKTTLIRNITQKNYVAFSQLISYNSVATNCCIELYIDYYKLEKIIKITYFCVWICTHEKCLTKIMCPLSSDSLDSPLLQITITPDCRLIPFWENRLSKLHVSYMSPSHQSYNFICYLLPMSRGENLLRLKIFHNLFST